MTRMMNNWRRLYRPCIIAFALAGAATVSAQAQVTSAQQSAIRSSCRSDFMSKCSGVTPGGKDALVCLQKNVASLSPACKTAVSATLPPPAPTAAAKPAEIAPPPKAAVTHAATAVPAAAPPPPKAAIVRPMKPVKHTAAAAVAAPARPTPAQQNALKQSCRSDFMAHCSGVTPGGKEALGCLQHNVTTLSAACKKVVSATMGAPAAATITPVAVAPEPAPAARESGPVPGGLIISKACARYVIMHCPGMGLNMGRKVACLVDYANSGHFVGPRCKAALKLTGHLR